jgi:TonB family protein
MPIGPSGGPVATISNHQRNFYLLLFAMLTLHVIFLGVQIKSNFEHATWTPPRPIKLKITDEVTKEINNLNKRQIVQSEDPAEQLKPEKPYFLSDKDRSFDRQIVAKNTDVFKEAAKGNATVTQKSQPKSKVNKNKSTFKDLKLSDIGVVAGDPMPKEVSRSPASESIKGMENGNPANLGLSATNDYVEEVALGDFTHLNTVEYKFYGFFHRIRQKLEQFWGKSIQEKAAVLFRSGRRLPANDNLITSLQITLNDKGEIIAVKILGTSGVRELDEAAIESFNQAGPFPNPPKDLLVNGKATIEWGFVVKS